MRSIKLLSTEELPANFVYPSQFLRVVQMGLIDLEPWYLLEGSALYKTTEGLTKRYPKRNLIPFARRQDNDDIACWQSESNSEVYLIHDFASSGWEELGRYPDFYCWLRRALEDFIEFDV